MSLIDSSVHGFDIYFWEKGLDVCDGNIKIHSSLCFYAKKRTLPSPLLLASSVLFIHVSPRDQSFLKPQPSYLSDAYFPHNVSLLLLIYSAALLSVT